MKNFCINLLLIFFVIFYPQIVHSQTTKSEKQVFDEMVKQFNGGRIDSAYVLADAAVRIPELQNNSRFWFYCGLIYKEAYKKYEKNNPQSPGREKSSQTFQKALSLETDVDIINDIKKNLKFIASTYYNDAVRLLKGGKSGIPMSVFAFDEYIELMKIADEKFDSKQKEIEYSLALGATYATIFENDESKEGDEYYELAKKCYLKVLELDPTQTSARYNIVVLETKYKTKQESLLREESQKKDLEIISLNAVKELAEVKLHESQLEEEANKKGLIILKTQQEKYLMRMKTEQDRKDAIAQEEKQKQQLILWSVLVGLIVVVVFSTLVYRNSRQQAKLNIELERKNNLIEIKNKELDRLSFVVSKSTNNLLIFNSDLELIWVNDTFHGIYGLTLEEFKKERGKTLFDVSSHPDIKKILEECIATKTSASYESLNITKDYGKRWFQSMLSLIFDEKGNLQNLLVIDSDITALKLIEEEIRQKNKDITDSIHYAKRIQQSILPSNEKIRIHLPEHFIFYQPKDIVSGDFYWMESVENDTKIIVAAVDCTGHGVPGALLTIIGNDLLNHIVNEMLITDPKVILKEMNAGIISRFSISEEESSREGMDMALITIDKSGEIPMLHYSGAYNSSFVIRDNELITLDAMRQHIGSIPFEKRDDILSHSMKLKKGDMIYIFSDGYADQIGGKTGKKFMKGRFKELLMDMHQKPMEEQKRILSKSHYEWRGVTFQTDDMLVMGFRI